MKNFVQISTINIGVYIVQMYTRVSHLICQIYNTHKPDQPSTLVASYAGRILPPHETLEQFQKEEMDVSVLYVPALHTMAGLRCLDQAPKVGRRQLAAHWAFVYKKLLNVENLADGDALAYVLAYEKTRDFFSEATNEEIETTPTPTMMILQYDEHRDHDGAKFTASWSNYSLYEDEHWCKIPPAEELILWDDDTIFESKEDIIDAVFDDLQLKDHLLKDDETYACYLVWPEQLDGVRLNFKTQEGSIAPLQPESLGIPN